jgi:hypothetical protein
VQDSRSFELQHTTTSMDASDNNTASSPVMATPTETVNPLPLREETAAILEQTFGDGDTISVDPEGDVDAEPAAGIGLKMCEKILETTTERTEDDPDSSAATEDYRGEPAAASTPLRTAMEKFRIVDIERTPHVAGIHKISSDSEDDQQGEENSAREMDVSGASGDAGPANTAQVFTSADKGDAGSTNSDVNSAVSATGDVNSTIVPGDAGSAIPGPSSELPAAAAVNVPNPPPAPTIAADTVHAGPSSNIPPNLRKVPAMVKPPLMPPPPRRRRRPTRWPAILTKPLWLEDPSRTRRLLLGEPVEQRPTRTAEAFSTQATIESAGQCIRKMWLRCMSPL